LASETLLLNARSSLPAALQSWEIFLNDQGKSKHTLSAFSSDIKLLSSYLPADQSIGSITTSDLNNFLAWMQNERGVPCSPKTLARRITSTKAFFRWLQSKGVILGDPAEKVVQRSVLAPLPDVLQRRDMDHILGIADRKATQDPADLRYATLVRLLLETGIKKGETMNLKLNHVDLDAPNGAILFVRYPNPNHRYKERKIQVSENWVAKFRQYEDAYDLSKRLFPWSQRRLEYLLQDLGEEAGLNRQLSFLTCRWTCALNDMEDGLEAEKIRQKLGVSEIQWRELEMKLTRLLDERQEKS
jgi:integrase/recombinase XerD